MAMALSAAVPIALESVDRRMQRRAGRFRVNQGFN
jgi:hypothetical protein